jgi:hypothetical protein
MSEISAADFLHSSKNRFPSPGSHQLIRNSVCLFEVCQKAAVKINFVVGEFQGNVQGPLTG